MLPSKIDSMYVDRTLKRIHQGDILKDIIVLDWSYDEGHPGKYETFGIKLPYSIVMTQDCDLERDFINRSEINPKDNDKYLQTILLCPSYLATNLKKGNHLEQQKMKMHTWNSDMYKQMKNQNNDRFHFLEANQALQIPELMIDFKHFFTIPRNALYSLFENHYHKTLNQLFREQLSQRFSNYLSRIGLPEFNENPEKPHNKSEKNSLDCEEIGDPVNKMK